jgi:uncharacterized transporter YbjL
VIQQLITIIQENPEVLLFLSLAIGYLLGKIKIKGIGTTASVLLAAMALGFAAPFAFAKVFLTVMGSIIINIM